jgi:glycosyltransferase involved in cell wall biosynthesis
MKKPHILIYSQYFPPESGAAASRMSDYARLLVREGYQVSVLCEYPAYFIEGDRQYPKTELWNGIQIYRAGVMKTNRNSTLGRLLFYISFFCLSLIQGLRIPRFDLLWVTSPPLTTAFSGLLMAKLRRVPYILDIRDLWPESVIQLDALKSKTAIHLLEWIEKIAYRYAAFLTLAVPGFKERISPQKYGRQNFCPLPNGVPESFINAPMATPPFQLNEKSRFHLLFSGNIGLAQGLDTLLDAAALLRENQEVHFYFVGDGVERSRLQERAKLEKLENLTFVGTQPRDAMPAIISAMSACIVPLRDLPLFANALPSKMFEYAARQKPLIVSIRGEAADWVKRYGAGIVIAPENADELKAAIFKLINNPALCEEYGKNGLKSVKENFTRARFVKDFDQHLQNNLPELYSQ